MWNRIKNKIAQIADAINGAQQAPISDDLIAPEMKSETESTESVSVDDCNAVSENRPSVLDNAIDRQDQAVALIVDKLSSARGSKSSMIKSLTVWVYMQPSTDASQYAWADDSFARKLRLALDNAMLEGVGSRKLDVQVVPCVEIPVDITEVIPQTVGYTFGKRKVESEDAPVTVRMTVVEGTGSLAKDIYELKSQEKEVWHIGRGVSVTRPGFYHTNDVVIRTDDADAMLQEFNNHVSSTHLEIVLRHGVAYVRALKGGCRSLGGACTKIVHGQSAVEVCDIDMLHPLSDGDMLELGKKVLIKVNVNVGV